jgi:hypothetical protein
MIELQALAALAALGGTTDRLVAGRRGGVDSRATLTAVGARPVMIGA